MKKLQKTFIIFTFIFLLVLSLTCNVYANDTFYTKTSTAKAGDTVYFEKPDNWGTGVPYIYAWDNYKSPKNKLGGDWPGVTMTLVENNLYSYTFENDINYTQLIFTSTDKSKQTEDLDYICNGYIYKADSTAENLSYSPISLKIDNTVYFKKPDSWSDSIFVYMWNSTTKNRNSDWGTTYMTNVSENIYSYTLSSSDWNVADGFDMIIFGDGTKLTKDLLTVGQRIFIGNDSAIESGSNTGKYDGIWAYTHSQISNLTTLVNQKTVPAADKNYYTVESYAIYKEQYDLAKTVINSTYVATTYSDLTSQYDKSLLALTFAYNNLKLNTNILSEKIVEMEAVDTSKYAPDLVDAFVESIDNSKNLLQNPSTITISDMKTAISNMETAYNNLIVDKSELEALINTAKNINSELYTDNSVQALRTALEDATNIYESNDSSYSDVQTQIEKLKTAISSLVEKSSENTDSSNTDNSTAETKEHEENSLTSNPYTGDIILIITGILILASIILVVTTIYLKKNKNK